MEMTIRNMDLIINNVKEELKAGNHNESKTLMNTYRTLLKRFMYLNSSDKRIDENRIMLESHKVRLMNLHQQVEKNVGSTITRGDYKNADTLVEVSWRLERASSDIGDLISTREKYVKDYNRHLLLNEKRINKN